MTPNSEADKTRINWEEKQPEPGEVDASTGSDIYLPVDRLLCIHMVCNGNAFVIILAVFFLPAFADNAGAARMPNDDNVYEGVEYKTVVPGLHSSEKGFVLAADTSRALRVCQETVQPDESTAKRAETLLFYDGRGNVTDTVTGYHEDRIKHHLRLAREYFSLFADGPSGA